MCGQYKEFIKKIHEIFAEAKKEQAKKQIDKTVKDKPKTA